MAAIYLLPFFYPLRVVIFKILQKTGLTCNKAENRCKNHKILPNFQF